MMDHASPATRLHDVVVVHEQTGAAWHAPRGEIRHGRVVVHGKGAPEHFFTSRATYSIRAVDGANRSRHFPSVALALDQSSPPEEYVFD
jgi:hypothetical protein